MMPDTSQNVFFSILYFAADRGLMSSAVGVSTAIVLEVRNMLRGAGPTAAAAMAPEPKSRAAMPCKKACAVPGWSQ